MKINPISGAGLTAASGLQSSTGATMRARTQAFGSLADAINSGDLSSAQTALGKFQTAVGSGSQPDPLFGDPTSTTSKDLDAVSKALDGGDINAAKSALSTLQSDMQASAPAGGVKGHGGHHHGGVHGAFPASATDSTDSTDPTVTSDLSTFTTSGIPSLSAPSPTVNGTGSVFSALA